MPGGGGYVPSSTRAANLPQERIRWRWSVLLGGGDRLFKVRDFVGVVVGQGTKISDIEGGAPQRRQGRRNKECDEDVSSHEVKIEPSTRTASAQKNAVQEATQGMRFNRELGRGGIMIDADSFVRRLQIRNPARRPALRRQRADFP